MGDTPRPHVAELVSAASEFIIGLRMREGVSEGAFQRLSSALRSCASAWDGLDEIPRLAANVLVDIFPAVEASRLRSLTASVETWVRIRAGCGEQGCA